MGQHSARTTVGSRRMAMRREPQQHYFTRFHGLAVSPARHGMQLPERYVKVSMSSFTAHSYTISSGPPLPSVIRLPWVNQVVSLWVCSGFGHPASGAVWSPLNVPSALNFQTAVPALSHKNSGLKSGTTRSRSSLVMVVVQAPTSAVARSDAAAGA